MSRLNCAADHLNQTYGQDDVHYRGPVLASVQAKGERLIVKFKAGQPLAVRDGGEAVEGFEIVKKDGAVEPVTGKLRGSSVIIGVEDASSVAAIRYAWDDNPDNANLMDKAGLPAEPFRAKVN